MKLIAENLTVTSARVRHAIEVGDPGPLRDIAARAGRCGAAALDVNLGPRSGKINSSLDFVLEALTGCWSGPLWIDGSDAELMTRAAGRWPHGVVLNGYSGNAGREAILTVAAEKDLDLVVLLMTDSGIPQMAEERLALAAELVGRANNAGVPTERIIIDPIVAPMGWMNGQALNAELLKVLKHLPNVFGEEVNTVLGLSNLLTTSAVIRPPAWLDEAFLAYAAGAGLTHAMVDMGNTRLAQLAAALNAFDGQIPFAAAEFA